MKTLALHELPQWVGQPLGQSDWLKIDQARIDRFADATGDHQWIHVDPQRAAQGPFGATVAHGYLTLSLLSALMDSIWQVSDVRFGLNYGLNRVRFIAPVPVGSRVRLHLKLASTTPLPADAGAQVVLEATFEIEAHAKPACIAEVVLRLLY